MNLLAAAEQAGSSGWVIAIVISILAGLVGTLVLFNLNNIKSCMEKISNKVDKHDGRIETVERSVSDLKVDIQRNTVSKEDWVRSEGYTRKELKDVSATLSRLEGKMDVVNRLPEISAEIAARTAERVIQETRRNG